jgi:hypothetical protein
LKTGRITSDMAEFEDRHWTSDDGLRLHFRDYPGAAADAQPGLGAGTIGQGSNG